MAGKTKEKGGDRTGIKHCPKCGSTDVNLLVFYRPSIWMCSDCGYEGAFIIEDGELAEGMQEQHKKTCNVIDWPDVAFHIDDRGDPTDSYRELQETT